MAATTTTTAAGGPTPMERMVARLPGAESGGDAAAAAGPYSSSPSPYASAAAGPYASSPTSSSSSPSPYRRRFEGRVAIVNAATAGIGLAIARRLLVEGAAGVAVCSRRAANVAAAVAELEAVARAANPHAPGDGKPYVLGCVCHVADAQQRAQFLAATLAKFGGKLDALVLNAAANPVAAPLLETPSEALDKLWEVNVRSAILMAGECAPHLERTAMGRRKEAAEALLALERASGGAGGGGKNGGGGENGGGAEADPTGRLASLRAAAEGNTSALLFVSSVTAFRPPFPIAAYAVTKTALLGVVRALADEMGPQGVRVVGLAPGIVKTKFAASLVEGDGERRQAAATVLGRLGLPGDMAGAAAFLLSEDAAYVTGETLVASGGMQSRL